MPPRAVFTFGFNEEDIFLCVLYDLDMFFFLPYSFDFREVS